MKLPVLELKFQGSRQVYQKQVESGPSSPLESISQANWAGVDLQSHGVTLTWGTS